MKKTTNYRHENEISMQDQSDATLLVSSKAIDATKQLFDEGVISKVKTSGRLYVFLLAHRSPVRSIYFAVFFLLFRDLKIRPTS